MNIIIIFVLSRRNTIAVPNEQAPETVVNMHLQDPTFMKQSPENEAIQQMLEESMFPPRPMVCYLIKASLSSKELHVIFLSYLTQY